VKIWVTEKEFLKGRDKDYPLNDTLRQNMKVLLGKINILRGKYKKPFIITSGYRPGKYNSSVGGAPNSAHVTCEAIDIKDSDGEIAKWILNNKHLLVELDLYMENPKYTKGWVHLSIRPTKSKRRVFIP